jgi:hypothetical protein
MGHISAQSRPWSYHRHLRVRCALLDGELALFVTLRVVLVEIWPFVILCLFWYFGGVGHSLLVRLVECDTACVVALLSVDGDSNVYATWTIL